MCPCVCRTLVPRIQNDIVTFTFQSKQSTRNSQYRVYEATYWHNGDGITTQRCVWAVLVMTHTHTHTHTHTAPCIFCVAYSSQTDDSWRWWPYSPSEHRDQLTQWHSTTTQNAWIYGNTANRTWNLTQNEVSSYLRDWRLVTQKHLLLESVHIISHIGTPAKKHIPIFCSDSHWL